MTDEQIEEISNYILEVNEKQIKQDGRIKKWVEPLRDKLEEMFELESRVGKVIEDKLGYDPEIM